MVVTDLKVREVRSQSDTKVNRLIVELEAKVRNDMRSTSLRILIDVRVQASHTGLEALTSMKLFL